MELKDTIKLMESEDFKDRFRAEYYQLKIRHEKLDTMLSKMENGDFAFKPKCSYELLRTQCMAMKSYLMLLEDRAKIEGIKLSRKIDECDKEEETTVNLTLDGKIIYEKVCKLNDNYKKRYSAF